MKPELQRIAIAEACGWRPETRRRYAGVSNVQGWGFNQHLSEGHADRAFTTAVERFPNYLGSLDAMAEAEKVLSDEQHRLFRGLLFTGVYNRGAGQTNDTADRHTVSATAPQRAEAFLRTLGKWQD